MFCEECGYETTEDIPKHAHTPIVTQAAVPHTCEVDGMTAAISCEECGQILQSAQSDPAPGHHEFGANGTEYQYCAVCGEVNPKWQGNDPGTGGNGEGGNGEGGNP